MPKSGIEDTKEVKHARLGEFKTLGDVAMYIQLPYYDDFWGFDVSGASGSSADGGAFSVSAI